MRSPILRVSKARDFFLDHCGGLPPGGGPAVWKDWPTAFAMSRLSQFARSSLRRLGFLKPRSPFVVLDGFDATIERKHVFEGCRRLGVKPKGRVIAEVIRRSVGVAAVGPGGSRSWVKISALVGAASHPWRDAELAASEVQGVNKPEILAVRQWSQDDRHWLAVQMTLAPSPVVDGGCFASAASASVGAAWIASLQHALDTVRKVDTCRQSVSADEMSTVIKGRFGSDVEHTADEWHCAHGDVHWANVTHPDFMLLDWEHWGLAPRGYDAAYITVFSCARPDFVRMLEAAFTTDLNTRSGRVARLYLLARELDKIDAGTLSQGFKPHLEAMARRVLAGR